MTSVTSLHLMYSVYELDGSASDTAGVTRLTSKYTDRSSINGSRMTQSDSVSVFGTNSATKSSETVDYKALQSSEKLLSTTLPTPHGSRDSVDASATKFLSQDASPAVAAVAKVSWDTRDIISSDEGINLNRPVSAGFAWLYKLNITAFCIAKRNIFDVFLLWCSDVRTFWTCRVKCLMCICHK